jgi:hypothetical protein
MARTGLGCIGIAIVVAVGSLGASAAKADVHGITVTTQSGATCRIWAFNWPDGTIPHALNYGGLAAECSRPMSGIAAGAQLWQLAGGQPALVTGAGPGNACSQCTAVGSATTTPTVPGLVYRAVVDTIITTNGEAWSSFPPECTPIAPSVLSCLVAEDHVGP